MGDQSAKLSVVYVVLMKESTYLGGLNRKPGTLVLYYFVVVILVFTLKVLLIVIGKASEETRDESRKHVDLTILGTPLVDRILYSSSSSLPLPLPTEATKLPIYGLKYLIHYFIHYLPIHPPPLSNYYYCYYYYYYHH